MGVLPVSEDTPGPRFAWQGGPCSSYAKRDVSGHNDIPQELWTFLLKRGKWLKVPFHVTQVIYNLCPGTDHPQGPNCRPTLPLAPLESTFQATKRRMREKGLDSTAAVNSTEVQQYGTPVPPTQYVEVSDDKGSVGRPILVPHYDDIDPSVPVEHQTSPTPEVQLRSRPAATAPRPQQRPHSMATRPPTRASSPPSAEFAEAAIGMGHGWGQQRELPQHVTQVYG